MIYDSMYTSWSSRQKTCGDEEKEHGFRMRFGKKIDVKIENTWNGKNYKSSVECNIEYRHNLDCRMFSLECIIFTWEYKL